MKKFDITGMSCAACAARIESAVSAVEGVTSCSVSLLTNSMGVDGKADESDVIAAVTAAGYGASLHGEKNKNTDSKLKDEETPKLLKRLIVSLAFLLPLMYVTMGHMMWGWRLPPFLETDPLSIALLELLFATAVMIVNSKFFTSGFKALAKRSPNMDSLVALGSSAAFIWSIVIMFTMAASASKGDTSSLHGKLMELYFESAAMILTLITVGKTLESYSKGKTTNALKALMDLAPKTARLLVDGKEVTVPADRVKVGDVFVSRPGDIFPVDGKVIEGSGAVDESAMTGESIPVDKAVGDEVSQGTVNRSGYMKCRADKVGEDTALSQIIEMVSDAAATKAPIAKTADRVSGVFVPIVIAIAAVTAAIWIAVSKDVGYALARGISVLVISCPCSLGLATPVAIMVGNGVGARNGILFKTAASLEAAGRIKYVVLDKTGTVTEGCPEVTDIIPHETDAADLLKAAYSLESMSEHPLSLAIVKEAEKRLISCDGVTDFEVMPGKGLKGVIDGSQVLGGNEVSVGKVAKIPDRLSEIAVKLSEEGKTPLFFAKDKNVLGIIAVADRIKKESPDAIAELKKMGIGVTMLTGDNEKTANAIAKAAGIDNVISGVLPKGKEQTVKEISVSGPCAMVGDGINDAPALTSADLGIAIGAGSDIAIDSADAVLVKSDLADVPAAIKLGRGTLRNIKENLFWALIYNTVGIPIAAGILVPLGITLDPMFAAAAMSLSSFCVVTNALRLNFIKIKNKTEEPKMTEFKKTLNVEGMMCPHCENAVKTALEAIPGCISAEVSHKTGTAVVTSSESISDEVLTDTVVQKGYKVTSVK